MQIRYSTLNAAINDLVACNVVISRPAFRGYGMMIANVGLPPGAEVDALAKRRWSPRRRLLLLTRGRVARLVPHQHHVRYLPAKRRLSVP